MPVKWETIVVAARAMGLQVSEGINRGYIRGKAQALAQLREKFRGVYIGTYEKECDGFGRLEFR